MFILLICLALMAWTDWKYRKIPNHILIFLMVVKVLELPGNDIWMLISCGTGFLAGGGLLLGCRLLFRGGIGAGDVKLFAVLGCWLGVQNIMIAAWLTAVLAACFSLALLLFRKINVREGLPMAPFVLAGVIGTMVWT